MAKRVILPPDAFDDICALLRLSSEQLNALDQLFSSSESASPLRTGFVNRVAETLKVSIDVARSVVMVCHFILIHSDEIGGADEVFVRDLLDDVREFVENSSSDEQAVDLLRSFDQNRGVLESLATPKPERLRAEKLERLASGPDRSIESFRTVCQLRPLFEGPEHEEQITGLVPTVLFEMEVADTDGDSQTFAFNLSAEALTNLEQVLKRTREKLAAIRSKYGPELLAEI